MTVQTDIKQVASITDRYTITSISYILKVIGGTIGLFLISWKLSIIVLSIVPLKIILVNIFSKKREKSFSELIEKERDFSQWFGDNLDGINEIKLWNLYLKQEKIFASKQKSILYLKKRNIMISSFNSFWEALLEWGIVLALYLFGGLLVHETNLTIGSVFAFVTYSWYVTAPISSLINLKMFFAEILPSVRRLFHLLDTEGENITGAVSKSRFELRRLEFKQVSFSYSHEKSVLSSANFHVDKGEKVALIGKNGSGKTTILNLLLGFLSPDSGEILVDGISIKNYSLDEYRSLFSVIPQVPFLFIGDIVENINLNGSATWKEISDSMKESGMIDFIDKLPEKEHTNVGKNGAKLSGGEKQKIALARVLIKRAPVLILDEPSTGLDTQSDDILHDVLVNHSGDQSVILITHNYEHLSEMDRVYYLDDGKISELQNETYDDNEPFGWSGQKEDK